MFFKDLNPFSLKFGTFMQQNILGCFLETKRFNLLFTQSKKKGVQMRQ